jgi:hypothetical protein
MPLRLRGCVLLIVLVGAMITRDPSVLFTALCALAITSLKTGTWNTIWTFLSRGIAPVAVLLLVVWGVFVQAPPGDPIGADGGGGFQYALVTTLRLAVVGAAVQTVLLAGGLDRVPVLLRAWGIRGAFGIVITGTIALLPETRRRLEQIVTARIARGALGRRTWWRQIAQVPHVLVPLMAWTLTSGMTRAEQWERRGILARFETAVEGSPQTRITSSGLGVLLSAAAWLIWAFQNR